MSNMGPKGPGALGENDLDDVPVTGVVIAQPQPCKYVLAQQQQQFLQQQQQFSQQQQALMVQKQQQNNPSPSKKLVKATPPPPPPRTTPVKPGVIVHQMSNGHGPVHGPPPVGLPPGATGVPSNPSHQGVTCPVAPVPVAAVGGGGAAAGMQAGCVGHQSTNSAARPANPAIQRPAAQHQQIHESPDEGYHEDDNGSEVL